jgi:pimeloyl-ACP methyl ester carboxylesterase
MVKQVAIAGVPVSYFDSGGDGAPVVLLHGWGLSAASWRPVTDRLREGAWRLIVPDLPGFGASPMFPHPARLSDYSRLVASLVRQLNLAEVALVGHSFGGRIAMQLAAEQPALVRQVVLVDSAGVRRRTVRLRLTALVARALRPLFRPAAMAGLRRRIYRWLDADDYVSRPELTATFRSIINEDLTPLLPRIGQPTLMLWGERDLVTPLDDARRMLAALPNARLSVLAGAGHVPFHEQPEAFAAQLKAFLLAS